MKARERERERKRELCGAHIKTNSLRWKQCTPKNLFFFFREISSDQETLRSGPHVQMEGDRDGSGPVFDVGPLEGHVVADRRRHSLPLRRGHQSRSHAG